MSAVLKLVAAPSPWRRALPALVSVLLAILLLYRDTFISMAGIWTRSETFAHAWLVPFIVFWLAWRRRGVLGRLTPAPQPWLILPMILIAVVWLLGDMAGINALTQLCATALIVVAVPVVLGLTVARQLTFPLAFLFFMVPIGDFLLPLMMEATADFTVAAVALSGVPVYREGLHFHIPTGAWSVVEACSGVRYLIASFMVGTLFAYLNYRSTWRRWAFVGVAIAVPIVANWLRAYLIVMLGHLSGNTLAVGVDHLIYGWIFFGVVMGLMFWIGSRWAEPEAGTLTPPPTDAKSPGLNAESTWLVSALAVAAVAAPALGAWQLAHPSVLPPVTLALPDLLGAPFAEVQKPLVAPISPGAAVQAGRVYSLGTATITVDIAYFKYQRYGAKLVSSENVLVRSDDRQWKRLGTGRANVAAAGNPATEMIATELVSGDTASSSGRRRLDARQVYWSGGRLTVSGQWATALGVFGRLTGQGDDGAIITFYTEGEAGVTEPRLNAFIGTHLKTLELELARVRNSR